MMENKRPKDSVTHAERPELSRRGFLAGAAAAAVPLALGSSTSALAQSDAGSQTTRSDSSDRPSPANSSPASSPIQCSIMMWTYTPKGTTPEERLTRVAGLGIDAVELVRTPRPPKNGALAAHIESLGLRVHNVSAGTSLMGKRGALTDPSQRKTTLSNLRKAIANARTFKTDRLLALAGPEIKDLSRADQRSSLVAGLKAMMEIVEGEGMQMIIEPLNRFDHRGHFLTSMWEGFEIVGEVASAKLKILFDIYHTQMEEGHIIARIRDNIDAIGHFHVADAPGRHQPGTGELNYANIYRAIAATGYTGHIGMEFIADGDLDTRLTTARNELFETLRNA